MLWTHRVVLPKLPQFLEKEGEVKMDGRTKKEGDGSRRRISYVPFLRT